MRDDKSRSDLRIQNPISLDAVSYFTDDTTTHNLIIFYRINPSFLFFVKSDNAQKEIYFAKSECTIEILDEKDTPVGRDFFPIEVERNSIPTEETPTSKDIQGSRSFTIKRGLYNIIFEAKDIGSGKSFVHRDVKVHTQKFSLNHLNISSTLFVEQKTTDPTNLTKSKFIPINRGGDILYGQSGGCLFQLYTPDTINDLSLSWKLASSKIEPDEEAYQEFQGNHFNQQTGSVPLSDDLNYTSSLQWIESNRSRFIFVPLPFERLEAGTFQLIFSLAQGSLNAKRESVFTVRWDHMPHSLADFRIAVDALKHIASEEEITQMSVFSSTKAKKAFKDFWNKQNPDTTRAYNVVMAEYYRRVDESIKRYSIGTDPDGYRTDRGRIYILFGSPSLTNRLFKPNSAPMEVWTYEKLKKRFFFSDDQKTGNYILKKTEEY